MGNLNDGYAAPQQQDMVWNQGMMPMSSAPSSSSSACLASPPVPAHAMCCETLRDTGNSLDDARGCGGVPGPEVDGPFRRQNCYTGGCLNY